MAIFQAGLCQMHKGNLVPYDTVTIDTDGLPNAIKRAKAWSHTVETMEGSWLQVLFEGQAVASLKPGEF